MKKKSMKRTSILILLLLALPIWAAEQSYSPDASADEFSRWQKENRAFLLKVLYNGGPPDAVVPGTRFGKKEVREAYELTQINFNDRPGHTTTGWLARPISPLGEKLPAIISLHGHGGTAYGSFDPGGRYYYGDLMAGKGYIVLALDIDHDSVDYVRPGFIRSATLPKNVPFPHMGQRVWMVRRAIDFLETQPDVDAGKIGIAGLSNGSMTAMFAAAVDTRIKLSVASGSLITHKRMWHRELTHCRCQYLDQMDGALDYSDVFALIAPRSLVIQNGKRDPIFPANSARKAYKDIEKAYTISGASEKVILDVHDGKHEFHSEVPLKWFENYLPLPWFSLFISPLF